MVDKRAENVKCLLKGESGKFLIDKGRVLEWTENRNKATVYIQKDADFKIINWPNTVLIKESIPKKAPKPKPVKVKKEKVKRAKRLRKKTIPQIKRAELYEEIFPLFAALSKDEVARFKSDNNMCKQQFYAIKSKRIKPQLGMLLKIKDWLNSL